MFTFSGRSIDKNNEREKTDNEKLFILCVSVCRCVHEMKERIMREKMNNAKLFDVFLFLCLCSRDKRKNIERKK